MTFGEKLGKLSADRGWKANEIARRVGVSPSTVGRWLAGERRPFDEGLLTVARVFEVRSDWLIDDAIDDPPPPDLSDDERIVVRLMRAQGLSADRIMEALANQPYRPKPGPLMPSGPTVEEPFEEDLDDPSPTPAHPPRRARPTNRRG